MERSVSKQYNAVDIAKLIMALLVVVIHKPLFSSDQVLLIIFWEKLLRQLPCLSSLLRPHFFSLESLMEQRKITNAFGNLRKDCLSCILLGLFFIFP